MWNKITTQILNKCLNEFKKEENMMFIENEFILPFLNRYNNKMRQLLMFIYIMYLIIILLLIIILCILLFYRKYL
jgi:hypothetical protein